MTMLRRVLVVDDEDKIIEIIRSYLETAGYEVFSATTGKEALQQFNRVSPALIVLDLMLPDLSGEEVCRVIRKNSRVPIIMLTAKVDEEDILQGLNIGADDYILKPFSPRQLLARVNAILRRLEENTPILSQILTYKNEGLIIDLSKHDVCVNGESISLTPNEYKILTALARRPHKTFTREELIKIAFGDDFQGFDRTIDSHIKNLRQKLEEDSKHPRYIITVHGVGYKFGVESI